MKQKNNIVFGAIFILILSIAFATTCRPEAKVKHYSHYVDTLLNRPLQVEKCGSCHQQVYASWKAGPHSHAYTLLETHHKVVDSTGNFPKGYSGYLNNVTNKICVNCHLGENLFETNFSKIDLENFHNNLNKDSFPELFAKAVPRKFDNKEANVTGVDCITCHVKNDQVVTNENSKAPDTLGIIKSKLFTNNINCFPCHTHQYSTMQDLVNSKAIPAEISCVNCHQEYDAKGKGTHYFYWRNDTGSKIRPKHLDIFDCINISTENKNGSAQLNFNWTNTVMPHEFSECGDAICRIVAVYKNKKEDVILTETLNRKDFFDSRPELPSHFHTGKNGNAFKYKEAITQTKVLKNAGSIDHILIIGLVKPQYWSTEKELKEVFRKKVPM